MKITTLVTATAIQSAIASNNAENTRLQALFDGLTDDNVTDTSNQISPAKTAAAPDSSTSASV